MKSGRLDGIELRHGVGRAVDRTWKRIGKPGTVWTGAQRVTIAQEFRLARSCDLCAERKAALSPFAVDGTHAGAGDLPAAAVDATHRIATDSGRLSSRWYDEFLDAGLGPQHLVELTGVAATVAVIDTFHRAVGLDPPSVPSPRRGRPSDDLADVAIIHSARVPTVTLEDAVHPLAEFYGAQDMVPNIMKALTLCPDETIAFYGLAHHLYSLGPAAPPDDWTLSRPQIELVAATVSNHNDCFY
jgi:hypothetical protein